MAWAALLALPLAAPAQALVDGEMAVSLTSQPGDPVRGRQIVLNRQTGLCLLCHQGPFPEERFQGTLGPELSASVAMLSAGRIRAQLVDARQFNPETIMPPYYRTDRLNRVAPQFAGRTLLEAQEIEDVVSFLTTLKQ